MQPLIYAALAFGCGIAAAGLGPAWLSPLGQIWKWALAALLPLALLLPGAGPSEILKTDRGDAAPARPAPSPSGLHPGGKLGTILEIFFRRRRRALAGIVGLLLCLSAGYARTRSALAHPPAPSRLQRAVATLETQPRGRVLVTGYARDTPELLYDTGPDGRAHASAVRIELEAVSLTRGTGGLAGDLSTTRAVSGGIRLYAYPPRAPRPADDWAAGLMRIQAGEGLAVAVHLRPLAVYHDPGVADFSAAARRQGIDLTGTLPLDGWRAWPGVAGPPGAAVRAQIWHWLSRRLDHMAPPERDARLNGLLRGMLLGDVSRLDETTRTAFQIDGVYHLLVVAGLHIGVLAAILFLIFRWCRLPRTAAAATALLLLGAYAWTISGRTPTLRALLMLGVYFAATLWYRERQALNAVGLAGLVLMAAHPLDLFAPGLELSLGAAALIAGVALPLLARTSRPLHRACRRLRDEGWDEAFPPRLAQWRLDLRAFATRLGWLWRPLGWRVMPWVVRAGLGIYDVVVVSLVLQLGFAGFNAVYFHRANPWSVAANAVLVPAASLLMPLAWAGVGLGALSTLAGRVSGSLVAGLGGFILRVADAMARWPGAGWRVPTPPEWFLAAFAAAVALWLAACSLLPPHRRGWRLTLFSTGLVAMLAAAMATVPFPLRLPAGLSATVLDVGQGDSILVGFPDGRTLLVDGGPRSAHWDRGDAVVAPFLWSLGLRRLDAVLLTHAHNDHLGGLDTVVADFHPDEVWVTPTLPGDPAVQDFLREVRAAGARLRHTGGGDRFLAGAARIQVLLPPPAYRSGAAASNDDSMVVRISFGSESMLLEGDAQSAGERWMLDHNLELGSALLKVGHHGSNTSSTAPFLAAVHPQVAVISDGRDNIYGFPAARVLGRLQAQGIRVFRTDRDGAVECQLEGGWLRIYLFRKLPGQS